MQAVGGRIIMIGHVYLQHWVIKKEFPELDSNVFFSLSRGLSSEEAGRRGGRGAPPGLVDLSAEEHAVGGDAAGGQQRGALVGRGGQLGHDGGARRRVGVHHAQEFSISEKGSTQMCLLL